MVKRLENDVNLATEWFDSNYMNLNQDDCHLMIFCHKFEAVWAKIRGAQIWESRGQKLLEVDTENDFDVDKFVRMLCKKSREKISPFKSFKCKTVKFFRFDSKNNLNENFY